MRCVERVFAPIWGTVRGRMVVAKNDAPVRANVRGIRHSTTAKRMEQQL